MADDYKSNNEAGINPVDSDFGKRDVYFTNEDFAKKIKQDKKLKENNAVSAARRNQNAKRRVNSTGVASTYLFFIIVIAVSMILSAYAVFCLNDIFGITKTRSVVTVSYTEEIDSASKAIDLLADNGLIRCKNFCKFFVSFTDTALKNHDVGGPYSAGVYYLYGKMGLEDMLITMQGEAETAETVQITFPEGYTVADIVDKLVDNEVCDRAALLSVIQSTQFSYSLVSDLQANENVPYRLEGYLFPARYDFYVGSSPSLAISRFLEKTEDIITSDYRKRAEEMGYSIHEIIIIASIVQAEAGDNEQMKEIAAVIENRLKDTTNYPSLGCQSTSDYIKNKVAPSLSSTSAHTSEYYLNYYNTNSNSTVVGLPEGPICNPGEEAIKAALYPAESNNYFFFHDTKGKLYTAETYSEFKSKIQTYAPYLSY